MDDEGWDELTKQLRYATFFGSFARAKEKLANIKIFDNNKDVLRVPFYIKKVTMVVGDLDD